ncbi:MAG: alpha-amylase family glycosyl hydrolase, partial [Spirochaetaceae bacterium]
MKHWWQDAFFYHIYPLGFCGAEPENPAPGQGMGPGADAGGAGGAPDRLARIGDALGEIAATGCNAIYLGPVLESSRHGYDTADYYHTDRRLGDNAALARLVERIHEAGMHVILDGVFHHVGRDFWAFRKLREEGEQSAYRSWFRGVDFSADNRFGDGFVYHGWEGNDELVALDLTNPDVVEHLLGAVEWMMRGLGIDGLRLDVAYLLNADFMRALRERTEAVAADLGGEGFWLMGEAIHGDYTELVAPDRLHSATNYECYKGLWSSHNDRNFFEIAHSLSRQFAPGGIYEGMLLYNFADNHDVDRVASLLEEPGHLYPLYALLMTMPGIPSVYYGSEYGRRGVRRDGSDRDLRPRWEDIDRSDPGLRDHLAELQALRLEHPALRVGGYRRLHVDHTTLVFERTAAGGAAGATGDGGTAAAAGE